MSPRRFPSACGKTNFAMLIPPDAHATGWKVSTVGDDIAWIKPDADGRLRAINPEAGFFGVAPGHLAEDESERDGDDRAEHDLHQRRAHAGRRRVVGRHDGRAAGRVPRLAGATVDAGDREADRREGGASERALHRAGRAVPDHRSGLGRPEGVPISAFIFGGRRATTMPLVYQAFNWTRGRLHRRHDGIGDDGRGRRRGRQRAPRSDGDAAVLRLPHGRLLPALDQDAAAPERDAARSST